MRSVWLLPVTHRRWKASGDSACPAETHGQIQVSSSSQLALPAVPVVTHCLGARGKPSPKLFGADAAPLYHHPALPGCDTSLPMGGSHSKTQTSGMKVCPKGCLRPDRVTVKAPHGWNAGRRRSGGWDGVICLTIASLATVTPLGNPRGWKPGE